MTRGVPCPAALYRKETDCIEKRLKKSSGKKAEKIQRRDEG